MEEALGQSAKGLVSVDPVLAFVCLCLVVVCFVLWRDNGRLRGELEKYLREQVEYERTGRREAEQKIERLIDATEPEPRRTRRS